jgi:hypothetical protein
MFYATRLSDQMKLARSVRITRRLELELFAFVRLRSLALSAVLLKPFGLMEGFRQEGSWLRKMITIFRNWFSAGQLKYLTGCLIRA